MVCLVVNVVTVPKFSTPMQLKTGLIHKISAATKLEIINCNAKKFATVTIIFFATYETLGARCKLK